MMKRKYKKYGLRYKKRGMQKIKTYRYPKRNILGDRSIIKLFITKGETRTIPINASFISQALQFNNLVDINTQFGSAPGLVALFSSFGRYRVNGIKLKLTAWPDQNSLNTPVVLFTNAAGETGELSANPTVGVLPELRWSKYRVCTNAGTGAKPTTLTSYYSTRKVWGPDATVKNDADFTGEINYSGNPVNWTAPALGPYLQYGLFTMGGTNPTTAINTTLKIEATVYVQLWQRRYT
nr:MAG TPA: Capsid protein [Cressdnaviricota sp.]